MGYTIENGKAVIWTVKVYDDEDEQNYTFFYHNLYDRKHFNNCPSRLPESEKKEFVSNEIGIPVNMFILKSKHSHNKQKHKNKQNGN